MPQAEEAAVGPVVNILIVDDDPAKLIALRAVLDPLGANVVETVRGHGYRLRVGALAPGAATQ